MASSSPYKKIKTDGLLDILKSRFLELELERDELKEAYKAIQEEKKQLNQQLNEASQQNDSLAKNNNELQNQVKRLIKTESELYAFQEQLDKQIQIYRKLYELGKEFSSTLDTPGIYDLTISFVVYELGFERVAVLERQDDPPGADEAAEKDPNRPRPYLVQTHDGFYEEEEEAHIEELQLYSDLAALQRLAGGQENVMCQASTQDPALTGLRDTFLMNEYVLFPLGGEQSNPYALLVMGNTADQAEFFTRVEEGSEFMIGAGNLVSQVSTAINNVNFYQALEQERASLEENVQRRTKELNEAYEHLKEMDQVKSQFFANVSHEIRTPLTLSIGPVEKLLREASLDDGQYSQLASVYNNQLRLMKLINELLDFAKLESGRLQFEFRPEEVVTTVKYFVGTLEGAAQNREITLQQELPEEAVELYLDRDKFEKIVMNLLSNAFKFTPDGGTIGVAIQHDEQNVFLQISDTGVGIPKEKQASIFDRFSQADSSEKRQYEGTGIGLAMVKEYVERHGGTIDVESEEGEGATFRVQFLKGTDHLAPEEVNQEAVADQQSLKNYALIEFEQSGEEEEEEDWQRAGEAADDGWAPDAGTNGPAASNGSTAEAGAADSPGLAQAELNTENAQVLVVDDTADMRRYVSSLVKPHYRVQTARDGVYGLEAARKLKPDLIISDVMMPRKSGYELCADIKNDPELRHIPVILLTAKAEMAMKLEGLEHGADDYLVKPFNSDELLTRSKNLIKLRMQERRLFEAYQELRQANEELNVQKEEIAAQRDDIEAKNDALEQKHQELTEAHEQLKSAQTQLVENEKMASLGQLTAGIAHELNNPINFISVGSGTLRNDFNDVKEILDLVDNMTPDNAAEKLAELRELQQEIDYAEVRSEIEELLGSLKSGAERTTEIVKGLRTFSRLDEDDLKMADVNENLDSTLSILRHEYKNNIEIVRQYGELPKIECYPGKLNQVFMNIITNAIQAIDKEQGQITLTTQASPAMGENWIEVRIADNGMGMTAAVKQRIFEPFYTTKGVGTGTGLGMSISYSIIQKHEGHMDVNTTPGEGTEFVLYLPVRHTVSEATSQAQEQA
jgi:signal transduction histidine kinase